MERSEAEGLLKGGPESVHTWNRRRKDGEAIPNLESIDLNGTNLDQFDLRGTSLQNSILTNASFWRANLQAANLRGSHLGGARLGGADLEGANLSETNLVGAFLGGAAIWQGDPDDVFEITAYLKNTDLSGAVLGWTSLDGVDLAKVRGLAMVVNRFPSRIGADTLERTARGLSEDSARLGEIEAFYRACGVREHLIEHYRSRIGQSQCFSAFISHSHKDKALARAIYNSLQMRGIRCFLDERDFVVGRRIIDSIKETIDRADKVLLCCSRDSLSSSWVEDEISIAIEKERRTRRAILIPINLDGFLFEGWKSGHAPRIRERLAADFTGWQDSLDRLEEQVATLVPALRVKEGEDP